MRASESSHGELTRSEKAYSETEMGRCCGGRGMGGLRLWKVFVSELKPLSGSMGGFFWFI